MEVKGEDYHVSYDPTTATITFQGILRLYGLEAYAPITQLLDDVVARAPETVTLNLRPLKFLNSSGIHILFRFVIQMRDQANSRLVVRGASHSPWQGKSLQNMQKLMPGLQLELV